MNASHVIMAAPVLSAGLALSFAGLHHRALLQPVFICWALFAAGVICFLLLQADAAGVPLGPFAPVIAVVGIPACGMSWLLSRALFRQDGAATLWPIGVVVALCLTSALIIAARMTGIGTASPAMAMIVQIHGLTSSTVLLLALVEPMEGFRRSLPKGEKLFRLVFILGYGALVGVSVVWGRTVVPVVGGDPDAALSFVRVVCASIALAGATLAVIWRAAHPMPVATVAAKTVRPVTADERALAGRITRLMDSAAMHTDPALKVTDLANALGVPDYRVSRAITGALGVANFNRLVNGYRIDHAKRLLADPACAGWSVLSIAMECGFGSIGPFNRAFKQATGATPGAWRDDHLASGISVARSASR